MRRPSWRRGRRAASAPTGYEVVGRPRQVRMPGASAWATRLSDAELADLVWDSGLDTGSPPLRVGRAPADRGRLAEPAARLLVFASSRVEIALEIDPPPGRGVRGRSVPATSGRLEVQGTAWGPLDVVMDAAGRFALLAVPPGPVRLVLRLPGCSMVATSWVLVD